VNPTSNVTTGSTVTVSINTTNLSPGTYTDTITVSDVNASNTPQKVIVTYNVAQQPSISLSKSTLSFSATQNGSTPSSQTFNISNGGGGTLSWSISDNATWLDVSPPSGTNSSTITASINTTNLSPGTYPAIITVSATGASNTPQTINVTYQVSANNVPIINLSTNSLSFSAIQDDPVPTSKTFSISNIGYGTMDWNVSDDASWLNLNPTSSTNNGTVTASINTTSLNPTTYNGTITVSASGASNTPQTINVSYTVYDKQIPVISLSTNTLYFSGAPGGNKPSDQSFTISNGGNGTLSWTVSDDADWLDLSTSSGTNTGNVTVRVNTTAMSVGVHYAAITITASGASNSPQTVTVVYTLTALPLISLGKNSIEFTAAQNKALPQTQTVEIKNGGGGTLNWKVSENTSWLEVTPLSGSSTGILSIKVNTTNLSLGTLTGVINITDTVATNSPQTIQVTYNVIDGKLKAPAVNSPYTSSSQPVAGYASNTTIPTISWNAISGAVKYGIVIYRYSSSGEGQVVYEDSSLTGTSKTIPDGKLQKGKWYRFKMRTLSNYDVWGDLSDDPYYFNILLDQPVRISPVTGTSMNSITPQFIWKRVPDATRYRLIIYNKATNTVAYDSHNESNLRITDTSYTLPTGRIEYTKSYKWDIAAYNEADVPSTLVSTEEWNFTTVSSKINLSADRLIFPEIEVGKIKDSLFTTKNTGNYNLIITAIEKSGTHASDFVLESLTFPLIILADQEKTINIKFTPNGEGDRYARIDISCNDPITPTIGLILRGKGKASAFIPNTISKFSGDSQSIKINTQLKDPFIVIIKDSTGKPIQGASVTFAINTYPSGATGQTLSQTSVVTGSDGKASTILTLGDKAGTYTVTATSPGTTAGPITFTATATVIILTPSKIILTSGNNQTAKINAPLLNPFVVTITDESGTPVSNVSISFSIKSYPTDATGQTLSTTNASTDDKGQAKTTLTLGSKVGKYTIEASSSGLSGSPITFTATATPGDAKMITLTSGDNQSGKANQLLLNPFVVTVTDIGGNPVPNVSVTFEIKSIPSGSTGDSLTVKDAKTDTNGQAKTILKLGNKSGTYTVTATSFGLTNSPITFTANVTQLEASIIIKTSGDNQSGKVNQPLTDPFTVLVTDAGGTAIPGVNVSFAITEYPSGSLGHKLSITNIQTDNNGQATTILTFGSKAGTYKVTATSSGLTGSPLIFTVTASSGNPTLITLQSGNNQSGNINTSLNQPFIVKVTDANGNPVQWVSVIFDINEFPSGAMGQSLSNTSTVTDSNGLATTVLTLGNKVGTYKVSASSTGLLGSPVNFTAAAKAAVAYRITQTSGDIQTKQINSVLSPFIVTVTDIEGNPVSGVSVTFSLNSSPTGSNGQSLNITNTTTDNLGQASTILKLGNKVGIYTILATSVGLSGSPVTFSATATPDAATNLSYTSGNNQSDTVNRTLKNPFVVTVADIGVNPLPGISVVFAISTYPNGATGQTLSITNATTDANGQASTKLTFGDKSGTYNVTASSAGLIGSPVTFTAIANVRPYEQTISVNSPTFNFPTRPNATDYIATDYRLIGLPGYSNKLITTYLNGYQHNDWQVYWDNGQSGSVNDYLVQFDGGANFYCVVGRAFWVIIKGPLHIKDSIPSAPLNADNQAEILLRNGWNLITNPFLNRIQWSAVKTLNNVTDPIYAYDGTFSTPTDFDSYIGYYFFNVNNKSKLTVPYNPSLSKSSVVDESYRWKVNVTLFAREYTDRALWFGISDDAKDGLDKYDWRKPRLVGEVPSICFYHPEWDKDFSTFSSDIKSNIDNDKTWEFEVATTIREECKLTFTGIVDIPGDYNVLLINESEKRVIDLKIEPDYKFTPAKDRTKLKVLVIKGNDKKDKIIADITPKEFKLGSNYPNPFNPSTIIPITIPYQTEVTLSIYNIIGNKIKTVYVGNLTPGEHTFEWDGKDDYGSSISSGIYIYRLVVSGSNPLVTNGVNLMGKMVLMK
jgi:hypothetical protein